MPGTEPAPLPIVLIGPMGAGKSHVGRKLAARLGVPFVDTDAVIVERHGAIEELFERHGEPGFRELERRAVAEAIAAPAVVSLGGGAVLHPETRAALADATVVFLTVDARAVAPRLRGGTRPLIAEGGIRAWTRIFDERRPLYRELADVEVDTTKRTIAQVVREIARELGHAGTETGA